MPFATDENFIKYLLRNPKRFVLYSSFAGIGWLASRLIPNDCQREVTRWQQLYYTTASGKDSLQKTKDALYEDLLDEKRVNARHKLKDRKTDSLVSILGKKADSTFKHTRHEH